MAHYPPMSTRQKAARAVAAGVMLAAFAQAGHAHASDSSGSGGSHKTSAAAQRAIAYAKAQLGKPYVWGGTGPDGFDCSGLTEMAWSAAGVSIPRTSEKQWAGLRHVPASQRRPGDLVFFAGVDGTSTAPGHVGLVIGKHSMVEAYGTGYPVRISQYGTAASAPGDGDPVGFAEVRS
jgi:cell wall-associated NlpC family hydrolase